jgi:amphi-Trp domain-containing protein
MRQDKDSFRHESLQDTDTIRDILEALTKGLGKGKLSFADDNGEIVLHPSGLLNLKVTAGRENSRNRVDIRITWQTEKKSKQKEALTVN